MGDLQTDQGESLELQFVPVEEFEPLLTAGVGMIRFSGRWIQGIDATRGVIGGIMPCVRRARLIWAEKAELWRRSDPSGRVCARRGPGGRGDILETLQAEA